MKTIADRLCAALEAGGHLPDPIYPTKRYRVYIDRQNPEHRFFVGKSGALRWGRVVTQSANCSTWFRIRLLDIANKIATKQTEEPQ